MAERCLRLARFWVALSVDAPYGAAQRRMRLPASVLYFVAAFLCVAGQPSWCVATLPPPKFLPQKTHKAPQASSMKRLHVLLVCSVSSIHALHRRL